MGKLCVLIALLTCLSATTQAASALAIGEAKGLPDGTPVNLSGVVTALDPASCYIESPDRTCGIWVRGDVAAAQLGSVLKVAGTLSTVGGERAVVDATTGPATDSLPILPLGMPNRWLTGGAFGYQQGTPDRVDVNVPGGPPVWTWRAPSGLNNTGLLVRTWGTVRATYYSPVSGSRWFYIDDGSSMVSDLADIGVLVDSAAQVTEGQFVAVNGISSVEWALDEPTSPRLVRVIRPRSDADVQVLKERAAPEHPFSDEFDRPVVDPRWAYDPHSGWVSVTSNPGWAKFIMPDNGGSGPEMVQLAGTDWSLELKVRPDFLSSGTASQGVEIQLRQWPQTANYYSVLAEARLDPPNAPRVMLADKLSMPLPPGATCFFRIAVQLPNYTASVSFDGVQFCEPVSGKVSYWQSLNYLALLIRSSNSSPTGAFFATYFDYVRSLPGEPQGEPSR